MPRRGCRYIYKKQARPNQPSLNRIFSRGELLCMHHKWCYKKNTFIRFLFFHRLFLFSLLRHSSYFHSRIKCFFRVSALANKLSAALYSVDLICSYTGFMSHMHAMSFLEIHFELVPRKIYHIIMMAWNQQ